MIDVEFIDSLCDETNRYARQKLDIKDKTTPTSRFHRWTPTNRQEMISFLALMLLQGLYPLPNEQSYFSFNGFGTMPYFNQIMTYNRYLLLKSMLHFVDNNTDLPTKTRLFKIQPILDYFNRKFASLYYPQQEIVIDESLLKWHGRLSFAQKINTKAAQVGVKSYELCESSTGYLWKFMVYAGKSKTTIQNDNNDNDDDNNIEQTEQDDRTEQTLSDFQPTNATAKIVFDLVQPLLHKGHTLIMDNFYNCPLLARCLKLRQTDSYGTQRLNREFIPASLRTISKTDLRHGELVATYCPDLSLIVWRDSNLVSMISAYHSLQIGTSNKYNRTTYKPSIVLDYNKYMGGVDRKDQYLSAHDIERVRNRVWYKKLFRRLFNVAVFNCYVIYHTKTPKNVTPPVENNTGRRITEDVQTYRLDDGIQTHHKTMWQTNDKHDDDDNDDDNHNNDDDNNTDDDNNKTKYKIYTDEPTDRRWEPLPHANNCQKRPLLVVFE